MAKQKQESPAAVPSESKTESPAASAVAPHRSVVASSARSFVAAGTILHDGTYYAPGAPLTFSEEACLRLLELGVAKESE